jgi:formylglycine-generating enzyme required for sulfatase activity
MEAPAGGASPSTYNPGAARKTASFRWMHLQESLAGSTPRKHFMVSALLVLLLSVAASGGDEESALNRYRQASKAQDDALAALEKAYTHAEQALTSFRFAEATRAPPLSERLAAIADELVAAQEQRPPPADAKEARARRRSDLEQIERAVHDELTVRGLADETLLGVLADMVAHEATAKPATATKPGSKEKPAEPAPRADPKELAARLAPQLAPWLAPDHGFELLWNELLYTRCEPAKTFKAKYDDYMAAGVELDRVRHPEFYMPGGAKTRPNMVYIPGGTYTVGPNTGFERRKHSVTLRPYLIDRCEVSNADYLTFLESLTPELRESHTPRHWVGDPAANGQRRPPKDKLDHPVVGVTWRDADAYAKFANKRLPTEDEWEVACRGKEAFAYPWGEQYLSGRCNDALQNKGGTVPVTEFPAGASPFRVLNMAGNVEEWTCSLEEGETFADLPSNIAPVIVRGGHYLSPGENVGGLFRWVAPGGSSREAYLGFRCVADLR